MLRKTIVAIAAAATIGGTAALTSTDASARGWGGHGGHFAFHGGFHHFGGFRHARFFGGGFYPYYAYGTSCWRFVPTRWGGVARVWVC